MTHDDRHHHDIDGLTVVVVAKEGGRGTEHHAFEKTSQSYISHPSMEFIREKKKCIRNERETKAP